MRGKISKKRREGNGEVGDKEETGEDVKLDGENRHKLVFVNEKGVNNPVQ